MKEIKMEKTGPLKEGSILTQGKKVGFE